MLDQPVVPAKTISQSSLGFSPPPPSRGFGGTGLHRTPPHEEASGGDPGIRVFVPV